MPNFSEIALDPTNDTPLYQQIAEHFAERIQRRALPKGYRLPPTRTLAKLLRTHRNTVVRAFEVLQSSGMIASVVGRGTFVTFEAPPATPGVPEPPREGLPWGALLSRAANAPPLARLSRFARTGQAKHMINLQSMQPSSDLLPVEAFQRCTNHVLRTVGPKALAYAPWDGLPRLREALAAELVERGIGVSPEEVLITSGSQQALDLVARALINPGDPFLLEEPTYAGAINLLSAHGANLMGVRHDDEGPDTGTLERLAAVRPKGLYVMPGGHNPTGRWISAPRREALVRWSRASSVPLIEDDYVADLYWEERARPLPLRALDGDVVYIGSFSKNLIPALRIGYVVCPRGLRTHLVHLKHAADLGSSLFLQYTLAEFVERGELRAHLRRTMPVYRARLDALESGLEQHLPKGFLWKRPRSGFSVWVTLPEGLHPEDLSVEAQRHGVAVSPGTLSSVDGAEHAGIRLTFCAEPPKRLVEGVHRLGNAIRALRTNVTKAEKQRSTTTSGVV